MPTDIEWADETWNPLLGCERVSKGCDFCYAIPTAKVRAGNPNPAVAEAFAGLVERRNGQLDWTGKVNLLDERLTQPLRWRRPRRVFVNSLSDLFHDAVPDEYIARVFAVMAATPQHTYQILTKRHGRMRSLLRDECRCHVAGTHFRSAMEWAATPHSPTYVPGLKPGLYHRMQWPLPNVWLGASVEDQRTANLRIPALLGTPAAVRWLSCEPLLGPVDLRSIPYRGDSDYLLDVLYQRYRGPGQPPTDGWGTTPFRSGMSGLGGVNWVVVGGESGSQARPMNPNWARALRDQCADARVPFLFKQWGTWAPFVAGVAPGKEIRVYPDFWVQKVGKRLAGRELDGRIWDEYPAQLTAVSA